ncbi:MAG: Gfo/Idh/MocA family oxidoreductase [Chthonomonas sp.]|nr:Gfo/Idh/MocA family oxidoreductase [Chthonomonas sp.]
MEEKLRWAILGTGAIAKKFAEGLAMGQSGELVAVGSRSMDTATAFSSEFGGDAVEGYAAVLDRSDVDIVYISLPHHLHAEWTQKAAQAGKHILCEKPFTLTLAEARASLEAVKAADVFFMEAFMYRCHPQMITLRELLNEGVIGKPIMAHAEFGGVTGRPGHHFRIDGSLGGGALMDVGCYTVSMLRWIAGEEPNKIAYAANMGDGDYDRDGVGQLIFPSGFRATFGCSIHCRLENVLRVYGEKAILTVTSPWFCNGGIYVQLDGQAPEPIKFKTVPHLWGHQADLVRAYLPKRQAPTMTWQDTLGNARTLDGLARSAGLKFVP